MRPLNTMILQRLLRESFAGHPTMVLPTGYVDIHSGVLATETLEGDAAYAAGAGYAPANYAIIACYGPAFQFSWTMEHDGDGIYPVPEHPMDRIRAIPGPIVLDPEAAQTVANSDTWTAVALTMGLDGNKERIVQVHRHPLIPRAAALGLLKAAVEDKQTPHVPRGAVVA